MSADDDLTQLLRQHATRYQAPDALRAGIQAQIAVAEAARQRAPEVDRPRRGVGWGLGAVRARQWSMPAAAFALGMLCMALVGPWAQRLSWGVSIEHELVMDHVQALRSQAMVQVLSTDRHTVKPWFQGRIDYAPPVFDFASNGFALVGGRIEPVRGQQVATLVYAHNKHTIDVYIQPSTSRETTTLGMQRGFSVARWADGAMQYWVVSDMDRPETEAFVQLWQAQRAASPSL